MRQDDPIDINPNPSEEVSAPDGAEQQKDQMTLLQEQLTATKQQAHEYLEGWQRARAEFANYKKRTDRELQDRKQNAAVDALITLLPVIDDFELAMSNIPADIKDNSWLDGVTLIHRKMVKLLEDQGVELIDPVGQVFDPNRHEAVSMVSDTDTESGYVAETLRKGYVHGDRVLRPALVRVAG